MIILAPFDGDSEVNVNDLNQIQWIIKIAGTNADCKDHVQGYNSVDIEKTLCGNERFIEDITFSTSHQNVNIYTRPATKYEVRQDENAIDVQIK